MEKKVNIKTKANFNTEPNESRKRLTKTDKSLSNFELIKSKRTSVFPIQPTKDYASIKIIKKSVCEIKFPSFTCHKR